MRTRGLGFTIFDNAFHVLWQTCAMVGVFSIPWIPNALSELRPILVPLVVGMLAGIITMPVVLRRLRPALARRAPWAFEE